MNALAPRTDSLIFAVPVPGHILAEAQAWLQANSRFAAMALSGDEALFADPDWADDFAEEIGKLC